ncbi:hypothetical protein BGZ65_003505 [Modicella reniformis]|uniref:Uncharacterized protein n=1 Tax=Modicella reniformis TaxID=1440133 RepID=A0A9P6MHH1_9FUNG|nr:hypothetical protein BGZ65_003505 [Modicella reniformis]
MQTPQQQQQQQFQHMQQQQQQRATAIQATGRMPNGRHGSFEMGQPSQGWAYGAGPLPGMSQGRPPMSGFPNVMQPSLLQQQQQQQPQPSQQQQQQQQQQHPTHQQEIDMSDFPALGSVGSTSSNSGLSASYASTAGTLVNTSSSAAGNNLSQEFSIEDDFPALPGARPNSAGSGRHFGSMQLHQQQPSHQSSSRTQQTLQHHPAQQQGQHLMQQSQLDGMGAFSSMISPTSGSHLQQSMQLQQQLASDMLFQQQQQLLHLNGT